MWFPLAHCLRTTPGRTLSSVLLMSAVAVTLAVLPAGALPAAAQSARPAAPGYDTSALPWPPATFEEQQVWEDIASAVRSSSLAPNAHARLARYYERKGLPELAAKESAAAVGTSRPAPAAPPSPPAPAPAAGSAGAAGSRAAAPDDPTDPTLFELSAFPQAPTTFEEQRILETLADPHTATNPVLLAFAHRQLGRYYAAAGRADLAGTEFARAVLADPADYRGYAGLAALSEATGAEPADGTVGLRQLADDLRAQVGTPETTPEPEPTVAVPADPHQWQEVSTSFNRRMNYLYTSNAWSNVYHTVFTNLYGH